MDIPLAISATALLVSVAILVPASLSDWRDREVSDHFWKILGSAGILLFLAYSVWCDGFVPSYLLIAIASSLLLYDVTSDREDMTASVYLLVVSLVILAIFISDGDGLLTAWLSIPVCYAVFLLFYMTGIVRGGADVKCLIALSMMFPMYPVIGPFPLIGVPDSGIEQIFVFSIAVLFLAAIMTGLFCLLILMRNIARGDRGRWIITSFKMDISKAESSHVWPLERSTVDGLVYEGIPDDDDEIPGIYEGLRSAGCTEIIVTPMIPFIVPMTSAVLFVALIGFPAFLL